jgi:formate dehydrogenase maturation protein FdhE
LKSQPAAITPLNLRIPLCEDNLNRMGSQKICWNCETTRAKDFYIWTMGHEESRAIKYTCWNCKDYWKRNGTHRDPEMQVKLDVVRACKDMERELRYCEKCGKLAASDPKWEK